METGAGKSNEEIEKMKKKVYVMLAVLILATGILLTGCGKSDEQSITVFNYGEYIEPEVLKQFENETGIKVKYEEAATPEELYTKFTAGAIQYDVLCTSDYMLKRMADEGRLQKIDFSSMEYSKNIGEKYWEFTKTFDPTNEYVLPYFWGTVGLVYDKTKVHGPVDSWEVLFNGEYKNEILMQNSQRDAFTIALKTLGYSLCSGDEAELREAQQLLLAQKPDVQAYLVDEVRDEMIAGNATIGVIYSGDGCLACANNENLEYVIPKEGTNVWVDGWVMTKDCQNVEAATKFLDFLCREDIAMMNFETVYYSTPNEAVIANLPDEIKSDETTMPKNIELGINEVNTQIDPDVLLLLNDLWKELKAE